MCTDNRRSSQGRRGWRLARVGLAACAVLLLGSARPAVAQDVVVSLYGGYFSVRGEDTRDVDDVIYQNAGFLAFDVRDFNSGTFGGDVHVGVGRFLEAGVGVGFYQRTVPTVYLDYVDASGYELEQELKLRQVPVNFTARIFPFGRDLGIQPYVGGGIALVNWRYSEQGDFIDFNNRGEIFRDRFVDEGNTLAPLAVAGIRFGAIEGISVGGEFRYQGGKADLDHSLGFAGDKVDLGGYSGLFTVQFRF